ncbi:hypothetical protein B0H12DRAFT_1077105 [Mycena haematopus]|nr:hypothetical protein B0H12DRAFT_1077105 [Mycena haematopus]
MAVTGAPPCLASGLFFTSVYWFTPTRMLKTYLTEEDTSSLEAWFGTWARVGMLDLTTRVCDGVFCLSALQMADVFQLDRQVESWLLELEKGRCSDESTGFRTLVPCTVLAPDISQVQSVQTKSDYRNKLTGLGHYNIGRASIEIERKMPWAQPSWHWAVELDTVQYLSLVGGGFWAVSYILV